MGWTPVNKVVIERDLYSREIVVRWSDAIVGDKEKKFEFKEAEEAFKFALEEFRHLCM